MPQFHWKPIETGSISECKKGISDQDERPPTIIGNTLKVLRATDKILAGTSRES
jgi:hypothetical protein